MNIPDRYAFGLPYWTMGEKYLHLARVVAEEVVKHKNEFAIMTGMEISQAEAFSQFEKITRWSDIYLIEPLLFDFYHGLELVLKGFVLDHSGTGRAKQMHHLTVLLKEFKTRFPRENELTTILGRYIEAGMLPDMLTDFLMTNAATVDDYHEVLRYPCRKRSSTHFNHFMLKYQGKKGLPFFRKLIKDTEIIMRDSVALSQHIKKQDAFARQAGALVHDYYKSIGRVDFRNMPRILRHFIDYMTLREKEISQLSFREMEAYIDYLIDKGLTHGQIAQEFCILRKFFDYLVGVNQLSDNVARAVFARANKTYPRHFTDKELVNAFRQHHPRS